MSPRMRGAATRDRRGRGLRGPLVAPGPLAPDGAPRVSTRRERFDLVVLDVVADLERRLPRELAAVEFAVEEVPVVPADWSAATVPLASVVRGRHQRSPRIVVFRRPIEARAGQAEELRALVQTVLVEQVAELLGCAPGDIDPNYGD